MLKLSGKISDRIRSGEIPVNAVHPPRSMEPKPDAEAVRHGEGHGLGNPNRDGTDR